MGVLVLEHRPEKSRPVLKAGDIHNDLAPLRQSKGHKRITAAHALEIRPAEGRYDRWPEIERQSGGRFQFAQKCRTEVGDSIGRGKTPRWVKHADNNRFQCKPCQRNGCRNAHRAQHQHGGQHDARETFHEGGEYPVDHGIYM